MFKAVSLMKPYISVIITAFNRREFLNESIMSVLKQSLPRDEFEIIVVKNFPDDDIDGFIEENSVKSVLTGDCSVGEMLRSGIETAEGEVISFLDDDDKFSETKLEQVKRIFSDRREISFFHNDQKFINSKSDIIETPKTYTCFPHDIVFSPEEIGSVLKNLKKSHLDLITVFFNLSSISVRKSVLINNINKFKYLTADTDHFIFYIANSSRGKIMSIKEKLTLYRIHNSTSNITGNHDDINIINRRKTQLEYIINSETMFLDLIEDSTLKSYILSRIEFYKVLLSKINGKSGKVLKQVIRLILTGTLKNIPRYIMKDRIKIYCGLLFFSIYYPLSQKVNTLERVSSRFPSFTSIRKFN